MIRECGKTEDGNPVYMIFGHLISDAEMKATKNGKDVCSVCVAAADMRPLNIVFYGLKIPTVNGLKKFASIMALCTRRSWEYNGREYCSYTGEDVIAVSGCASAPAQTPKPNPKQDDGFTDFGCDLPF